jgi:hypothetical protein
VELVQVRRILLAILVLSALAAAPVAHANVPPPRFSTDGRWIVDASGRKLVLRGLDVMGAEFTPTAAPLPFSGADFATIRAMGATVVRIPIAWANIEPTRGRYDPAALARAHDVVAAAGAAGLLVVLDMHQWHWSPCYGGNGMPEWATSPCPYTPATTQSVVEEAIPESAFWRSADLQSRFADAWAAVVTAVGAPPYLLGYDLLNEPPNGTIPPAVFERSYLVPLYRKVAARIRAIDPGGLIVVEPPLSASITRSVMPPLHIDRAVYSTHLYADSLNDAAGRAGDVAGPAQFAPELDLGAAEAARVGAAFWPGEWGNLDETQTVGYHELQYAEDMLAAQYTAMVGSAYWTFWNGFPFTTPVRQILTRPSVFAVAGTPVRFSGTETALSLRWVAGGGGVTTISVPASWTAPAVTVDAGVVTVARRPGWVDLSAPPGSTVAVTITGA